MSETESPIVPETQPEEAARTDLPNAMIQPGPSSPVIGDTISAEEVPEVDDVAEISVPEPLDQTGFVPSPDKVRVTSGGEVIGPVMVPPPRPPVYNLRNGVSAVKISGLRLSQGGVTLIPAEAGVPAVMLKEAWINAHNPQSGDYCIVEDGNPVRVMSAEAFESFYAPIL